jgi:hypothetical protein
MAEFSLNTDVDVLDRVLAAGEGRLSLRLYSGEGGRTILALYSQDQWVAGARGTTVAGAAQKLGMDDWCQEFLKNHQKPQESQDSKKST